MEAESDFSDGALESKLLEATYAAEMECNLSKSSGESSVPKSESKQACLSKFDTLKVCALKHILYIVSAARGCCVHQIPA